MAEIEKERINELVDFVRSEALSMGYKDNVVFRNATNLQSVDFDKGAYFGYINPDEAPSGAYSDFSLVFFPQRDCQYLVVSFTVGSLGFKNDLELAMLPWTRRLFNKIRFSGNDNFFFKNDFSDIETPTGLLSKLKSDDNLANLRSVITSYKNVLQACQLLSIDESELYKTYISAWLAQYAILRSLPTNNNHRKEISRALGDFDQLKHKVIGESNTTDEYSEIKEALFEHRFIILQGAPGTGKTYNALQLADKEFQKGNVLFEQFHAETSYSDFVYGIIPNLQGESLSYKAKQGVLYQAIQKAQTRPTENILLIIDEINRANLSNVLGPIFYLFERQAGQRTVPLKIGDIEIATLPHNLYVIGTMNTADRSLAVVDFALRRRFTWIALRPHVVDIKGMTFHHEEFNQFAELFEKYATDEELNLQPGQSYFITHPDESMDNRLRYELMPLMKEYFNEGYLAKAKDDFSNYFYQKIGLFMYE